MPPPNNRLALPARNAMLDPNALGQTVSEPYIPGTTPTPASRFVLGRELENFSIGIGRGITEQLEGTKQMLTDPVGTVRSIFEVARQIGADPMSVLRMLQLARQQAMSGALGVGELIGGNIPLSVRGAPAPVRSDIIGYHRTTTPFEGEFRKEKNQLGVSFAGPQGYYFSPDINDPTTQIFGRHVIKADVKVKKPAPVFQVSSGARSVPRSVFPVSKQAVLEQIKKDPRFLNRGGLVAANSADDVVAGKTMAHADTWKEQEKNLLNAAEQGKLFRLVNPEVINDFDVELLKQSGFDGFIYQRPKSATDSMPSQIVAIDPKQIERLAAFRD
jgi:hypothetical protein